MSTYIVTGGAGFIGSNLVGYIMQEVPDARIIVVDNMRTGTFENLLMACRRYGVGPFRGEVMISPWRSWGNLVAHEDPDAVFHLASITDTTVGNEREMISENTDSFKSLFDACSLLGKKLIYASSAAVYGAIDVPRPFGLSDAGFPANVYGFSKWMMEQYHRNSDWYGAIGLRYFNVFGPNEQNKGKMASMIYQIIHQVRLGMCPQIFFDGEQRRDQVYVDDVVSATFQASMDSCRPGIYNIGSGNAISFNEIVKLAMLRFAKGRNIGPRYIEMSPKIRKFYQSYTCASLDDTESGIKWQPNWKFEEAFAKYADWIEENVPQAI